MRKTSEELKEVMNVFGVSRLWSWSKINTFRNSKYEYYLKYIAKVDEDRANSIYVTTGGMAHNILENYYENEIPYGQMVEDFEDGWMTAFDIADLKFDRNDEEHNKQIADHYYDDLKHFFMNHKPLNYGIKIEEFMTAMIDNSLFQGYIDAYYEDKEGNVHIIDFKTSSIYKGNKAENEAGQLILYAISMNQKGIPFDKIRICWNFLKYVSVQYEQANGAVKTRDIERYKIGESLQTNAKMWLKKFGYEENIDYYLKQMIDTNSIDCLPDEVRKKYSISDCYVYVPITDKLIEKWINDVSITIKDIELREKDYYEMKENGLDEETCSKSFWDDDESVSKNSYYFSTLCSYSPSLHLPYKAYLEKIERQSNGLGVFDGVGSADVKSTSCDINSKNENENQEIDLSWLDNL